MPLPWTALDGHAFAHTAMPFLTRPASFAHAAVRACGRLWFTAHVFMPFLDTAISLLTRMLWPCLHFHTAMSLLAWMLWPCLNKCLCSHGCFGHVFNFHTPCLCSHDRLWPCLYLCLCSHGCFGHAFTLAMPLLYTAMSLLTRMLSSLMSLLTRMLWPCLSFSRPRLCSHGCFGDALATWPCLYLLFILTRPCQSDPVFARSR